MTLKEFFKKAKLTKNHPGLINKNKIAIDCSFIICKQCPIYKFINRPDLATCYTNCVPYYKMLKKEYILEKLS